MKRREEEKRYGHGGGSRSAGRRDVRDKFDLDQGERGWQEGRKETHASGKEDQ